MIVARAEAGKNYGVIMLPEGLIEFIPEFNHLISDINDVLASGIPTTIGELHSMAYGGRVAGTSTTSSSKGIILGCKRRLQEMSYARSLDLSLVPRGVVGAA